MAFVTVPSGEAAQRLARGILEKSLAACVNIIPGVESLFWWKGKIDRAEEWILMCKTRFDLAGAFTEYVRENHEYEVPEVIVLPITEGNPDYFRWIGEVTSE